MIPSFLMAANLGHYIVAFGYIGIFLVIFAESGFLLGFFLPGDSLLFTIGILSSQEHFNIWILLMLCSAAAILGDNFGYYCGKRFGPKIFVRENSFFFSGKNVERTKKFFDRYGKKTIILARFVPVVRTFAPIMAGVGEMPYRTFFSYNIIGGILWCSSALLAGHFLGKFFPGTEKYLSIIILVVILISLLPVAREFIKKKKDSDDSLKNL